MKYNSGELLQNDCNYLNDSSSQVRNACDISTRYSQRMSSIMTNVDPVRHEVYSIFDNKEVGDAVVWRLVDTNNVHQFKVFNTLQNW